MRQRSNDMDDLESDIGNLAALLEATAEDALEISNPDKYLQRVQALIFIARDLSECLVDTMAACHSKVIADRRAEPIRMTGGARS